MALGYQNPFYLKQAQQKQQSMYNSKVLLEKHDPPAVYDSEETLELAKESCEKMKQLNKEIKPANYTKINHLSGFLFLKRPSHLKSYLLVVVRIIQAYVSYPGVNLHIVVVGAIVVSTPSTTFVNGSALPFSMTSHKE
ncbi:hypothetical protein Tco_0031735 [Tanacetum coccineum]